MDGKDNVDKDHTKWQNLGTLASLARTCSAFRDAALDTLWSHLDSLFPLLLCMASGLWIVIPAKNDGSPKRAV